MTVSDRKGLSLIARIEALPSDAGYYALKEIIEEAKRLPSPIAVSVLEKLSYHLIRRYR